MGDRGIVIIMPPGGINDLESLRKHPETQYFWNHWGGSNLLLDVRDTLKKIGVDGAKDREKWARHLPPKRFEQLEEYAYPDHAEIFINPEEGFITYGPELFWEDAPVVSFKELSKMSDKEIGHLQNWVDAEQLLNSEQEYRQEEREKAQPYLDSQRADREASYLVAGIPLALAGVLGAVAHFQRRA